MIERRVRCLSCNHEWTSKVANPRCSECGSRDVEDVRVEATIPPPPLQVETDYSKVFTAFDEGKTLIDVVKQGLCEPDKALELWNKYEEFKNKVLEIEGRPILEERVADLMKHIFDLKGKVSNLERSIGSLQQMLSNLRNNICPSCGQPTVILFARCRNCGIDLERQL